MNKQELIKQLKEMQVLMDKSFDDDKLTGRYNEEAANRSHNAYSYAIMVSEQLDEPSREECRILDDLEQKDQRIAELEKEIESIGRLCDKLNNDYEEINKNNIHQTRELTQAERELKYCMQENTKLEAKLENAIVPKFNFGDTIFAVVTYIDDPKDKTVIESGIVQKIECDKNQIKYWCDNGRIYWEDECEKLFATEQEAQQKLKELEK